MAPDVRPLAGLRFTELAELLESRARAAEVLRWMHRGANGVPRIRSASWSVLRERCELPRLDVVGVQRSSDGAAKYLLGLPGAQVELVRIPHEGRTTLCLSSQAGCSRRCRFCATARLGLGRNLSAAEMVLQLLVGQRESPAEAPVTNVVFMGMGEPLDNLEQVLLAVELLTQSPAPQLRAERITVSTSGIVPAMEAFLARSKASLALSLNATTDEQRDQLMPHNRQWPIARLCEVLRADRRAHPRRYHFIEYVMLMGVNDSDADAERLVQLLEGINARVNLIPHNPFPDSPYRPAPPERVRAFQHRVFEGGLRCLERASRGQDIQAACGQLARADLAAPGI